MWTSSFSYDLGGITLDVEFTAEEVRTGEGKDYDIDVTGIFDCGEAVEWEMIYVKVGDATPRPLIDVCADEAYLRVSMGEAA